MKKLLLSLLLSAVAVSSAFSATIPERRGVPTNANIQPQSMPINTGDTTGLATEGPLVKFTPMELTPEEQAMMKKAEADQQKRMDEQYAKDAAKLGTSVALLKKSSSEFDTISDNLMKAIPLDRGMNFSMAFGITIGYLTNFMSDPKVMATDFAEWKKSMATVANFFNDYQKTLISTLTTIVNSPTMQQIARDALKKHGVDDQNISVMITGITTLPNQLPEFITKFKTFADYVNMNIKHV